MSPEASAPGARQLALRLTRAPAASLDNFVAGPQSGPNAEALNTLKDIADGLRPARIVLLSGPPGSGKTHLLQAIGALPGTVCLPQDPQGFEAPTDRTVFIADDVTDWSDADQHRLFHLINLLRRRTDALLIAASGERPSRMVLREDLRTRLAAGLVLGLQHLSDEDKAQTLHQHAAARGLKASDQVIRWLLTHKERDIRYLITYLDALDQYALQTRRQLTVPLLREFERNALD